MSYVYLPPRTSNFFPPGPPYLAGFGLGDYAADLATYNKAFTAWKVDHLKWLLDKSLYTTKLAKYNQTVKDIETEYSMNMAAYNAALSDYYTVFAGVKRGYTDRSRTVDQAYSLQLPKSYYDGLACLTQAEHDAYARNCQTVKGLGRWGLGSNDPDCGYAKLPICAYPTKPEPPTRGTYPTKPTLRAEPQAPTAPAAAPVVTTTPSTPTYTPPSSSSGGGGGGGGGAPVPSPTPDTPVLVAPPQKQANVIMNGLIIVAVLGGGYLVYRTLKKPKAA